MTQRFIFRIDSSKENDDFFSRRCAQENVVAYSGTTMMVGPGWIPDLVEIDVDGDKPLFTITLIELEASDITARASCRKYLPEASTEIVSSFLSYLESVLTQCKATADPRLDSLRTLRQALAGDVTVVVRTAGALRSSSELLELHALLDQPDRISMKSDSLAVERHTFVIKGSRSFSREETDGIRRAVRILHAVVTGNDHGGGTLHSWANILRKPLDTAVSKERARFVELAGLLNGKSYSGMRIDCDRLVGELVELWVNEPTFRLSPKDVADAVRNFAPVVMRFAGRDSVRDVFIAARSVLEKKAN